jgi:VanZ family protein
MRQTKILNDKARKGSYFSIARGNGALVLFGVSAREFGKYWLPVLIWMAMIFGASTDLGSTQHTSRIIRPFLQFFWPNVSDKSVHEVQVAVRKAGHLSGYAVLGLLIWRAKQKGFLAGGWSWRSAQFAEVIATVYAATDEFHQSFVPTREASVWDVLIDATGSAIGLAVIWAIGRLRRKW